MNIRQQLSKHIATAAAWHSGQTSGLYSFCSTEKVHSEELRQSMLAEIESEIADLTADNFQKTETFSTEEIEALNKLRLYIKSVPSEHEDDIDDLDDRDDTSHPADFYYRS